MLSPESSSATHLEALNRLNDVICALKWYSDYLRILLKNVPNRDATLSQLDNHELKVKEIQQLQNLVLKISKNTEIHVIKN